MDFARETFFDAPFPSADLVRDGAVDLGGFPNPTANDTVTAIVGILSDDARGFSSTSAVYFTTDSDVSVPDGWFTEGPAMLVDVDPASPELGRRFPIELSFAADGGPFGAPRLLSMLPMQGLALRPTTLYAAVLTTELEGFAAQPGLLGLADGTDAMGLPAEAASEYRVALTQLGLAVDEIAGLSVFRTDAPAAGLGTAVEHARALPTPEAIEAWELTDVFDTYCVFESLLELPVYQSGEPPYTTEGGDWRFEDGVPQLVDMAESRIWVTVPRLATPTAGWPVLVMSRTGGGGDRPLVDRGVRDAEGEAIIGTGPAYHLSLSGWAGVQVDGPHGGPRNPTGADEQFLMFNVTNLEATRDNVRQAALELALLPDVIAGLDLDTSGCPDTTAWSADVDHLALMGHSMGATIAPLTLAVEPRFGLAILSGAGGSYIHNIMHKQSPLDVRPLAEALLGYSSLGLELTEHDPALSMLQWAAEAADPPPYDATGRHLLVFQGIVDTYIPPPLANAIALSAELDIAGEALDVDHPELIGFEPLVDVLPYGPDLGAVELPTQGNRPGNYTGVVLQVAEDGVEDGHEVMFQVPDAKFAYRCLLETWAAGETPAVHRGDDAEGACP